MSRISRRTFMSGALATGAALTLPTRAFSQPVGANDDIRLAVIGIRGQGNYHLNIFSKIPGVRIVAICDVDKDVLKKRQEELANRGIKVKTYVDARKLLEDKEIDAITTATPNHWHALITIWACQAGKDVYVEKPISHEIWEGQQMIKAARKYNRIVQAGTQKRSDTGKMALFKWINEGNIGKIEWTRGLCYKRRGSIGKVNGPQPIPSQIDYNMWCGPADMEPLHRKSLHYDWHWDFNTGNGDVGNQGIHEMDQCRWVMGEEKMPKRVLSFAGRLGYDDDGNTPNTHVSVFEYDSAPLIFEVRGLPRKAGDSAMDNMFGTRIGIVIKCEGGYFSGGDGGGWVYDNDGKKIKKFDCTGGRGHHENYIEAIRSRKVSDLNADIAVCHVSTSLCHMGNISYLLGQKKSNDEIREGIQSSKEGLASLDSYIEHLEKNEVDLKKTPLTLGATLDFDPDKEEFVGDKSTMANMYLKRNYREPFIVPDNV